LCWLTGSRVDCRLSRCVATTCHIFEEENMMRNLTPVVVLAVTTTLAAGCSSSPTAPAPVTTFTISLANNGTQAFLTPFPDIQIQGASVQGVVTPAGTGKFAYDLTVHVVPPNDNSKVSGTLTFDFGSAGTFTCAVTSDAISGPPTDIAGVRTTVTTVPFTVTTGTGRFSGSNGSGTLVLTNQRASDTSPTSSFVSSGTMNIGGLKAS
jgi:hypothetical protein